MFEIWSVSNYVSNNPDIGNEYKYNRADYPDIIDMLVQDTTIDKSKLDASLTSGNLETKTSIEAVEKNTDSPLLNKLSNNPYEPGAVDGVLYKARACYRYWDASVTKFFQKKHLIFC